jgi:hypothetical protein
VRGGYAAHRRYTPVLLGQIELGRFCLGLDRSRLFSFYISEVFFGRKKGTMEDFCRKETGLLDPDSDSTQKQSRSAVHPGACAIGILSCYALPSPTEAQVVSAH